jgi:hypothetical protein
MAERKSQRQIRCQNQYVYDRLSSEKMFQVYHWLVPEEPEPERIKELIVATDEKVRSHLRPSFL